MGRGVGKCKERCGKVCWVLRENVGKCLTPQKTSTHLSLTPRYLSSLPQTPQKTSPHPGVWLVLSKYGVTKVSRDD